MSTTLSDPGPVVVSERGGWPAGRGPTASEWAPDRGYPDTTPAPMSTAPPAAPVGMSDRQLLAAMLRWARAHGWTTSSTGPWTHPDGARVDIVPADPILPAHTEVGIRYLGGPAEWHVVATAQEAADWLVVHGLLPVEWSSAYRAGYGAGYREEVLRQPAREVELLKQFEQLAHLVGRIQVVAFATAADADADRLARLRELLEQTGHGNPFTGCPCCGDRPWCPDAAATGSAR